MLFVTSILFLLLHLFVTKAKIDKGSNLLNEVDIKSEIQNNDLYLLSDKVHLGNGEKVDIRLYYEAFCMGCMQFDTEQFAPVVEKLHEYLDIHPYPFGNAIIINKDGVITVECQNGPHECYGNMLHACAIDYLKNITKAVIFNACMMKHFPGSNDATADKCGASMSVDPEPIKKCAKGPRGQELLIYYGEESRKAHYNYVPYVLINGKVNDGDHFLRDVCKEYKTMPPPCVKYLMNSF